MAREGKKRKKVFFCSQETDGGGGWNIEIEVELSSFSTALLSNYEFHLRINGELIESSLGKNLQQKRRRMFLILNPNPNFILRRISNFFFFLAKTFLRVMSSICAEPSTFGHDYDGIGSWSGERRRLFSRLMFK